MAFPLDIDPNLRPKTGESPLDLALQAELGYPWTAEHEQIVQNIWLTDLRTARTDDKRRRGILKTSHHGLNTALYVASLRNLSPQVLRPLIGGALLHDNSKIHVPELRGILQYERAFSPVEYALMKEHARLSKQILGSEGLPELVVNMGYGHHEKGDGSGYPAGSNLSEIPLSAQIMLWSDILDVTTTEDRPYNGGGKSPSVVVTELRRENKMGHVSAAVFQPMSEIFRLFSDPDNLRAARAATAEILRDTYEERFDPREDNIIDRIIREAGTLSSK